MLYFFIIKNFMKKVFYNFSLFLKYIDFIQTEFTLPNNLNPLKKYI